MKESFDIVIIGAGLIGSSIAYHLAQKKSSAIALIDLDFQGKYSSSELNAGGIRAGWWHEINIQLAKATIEFLETNPDQFGFRQKGYLWLYDEKGWKVHQSHAHVYRKEKLNVEELTPKEVQERIPYLDRLEGVVGATFSPRDGIFNANLLKQHFRDVAKQKGVIGIDGIYVKEIFKKKSDIEIGYVDTDEDEAFDILTQKKIRRSENVKKIKCKTLVNAAGAWAAAIAILYEQTLPTRPVRRQISIFDCQNIDLSPYGMIVDTSGVYFHAEASHILSGYAIPDEPSGFNFKYEGDTFFEHEIWPRLMKRMSAAEALKHRTGWAGLYADTPDKSGIMGRCDSRARIYEANSFAGMGAMQSYGVGLLMAELILDGKYQTIDATGLHPDRFRLPSGKLLYEGMSI